MASTPRHVAAVVLDNEAAQAVADVTHPKHRWMLAILEAAVDGPFVVGASNRTAVETLAAWPSGDERVLALVLRGLSAA